MSSTVGCFPRKDTCRTRRGRHAAPYARLSVRMPVDSLFEKKEVVSDAGVELPLPMVDEVAVGRA